jgi:hypothetical protein
MVEFDDGELRSGTAHPAPDAELRSGTGRR